MAELQHAIAVMDLEVGGQIDEEDLLEVDILIGVCAGLVFVKFYNRLYKLPCVSGYSRLRHSLEAQC